MKKFIIPIWALALVCALGAQELKYPVLPEVVMLSTGRILKKPVVKKCGAEMVVLGGQGWSQSVRYDVLPDDVRSALEPFRPGGAQWFAGDTSDNTTEIQGQIFIQTQGSSSYKFGNVDVYLFDLHLLSRFSGDTRRINLPRPMHKTTTDGDGKFTLKVPKTRPYFIFAQAWRAIDVGSVSYEWRVPMNAVKKGELLRLASEHRFSRSEVEIEEQR